MRPIGEHATNNRQTYMVTSSTWGRRALFHKELWARLLIDTLYHYRASANLLHAFVIMPHHVHVILTPRTRLEKAVQFIYVQQNPLRQNLCEVVGEYPYSSAYGGFELDPVPQGLKPAISEGPDTACLEGVPFQSGTEGENPLGPPSQCVSNTKLESLHRKCPNALTSRRS